MNKNRKPIFLTSQIRQIEASAATLPNLSQLMEQAGLAAANLAQKLLVDDEKSVLVLAGNGNNGGDAFVVARHLKQRFYQVCVVFTGDHKKLPADARQALDKWLEIGGTLAPSLPDDQRFDLIVDGLFGIGLNRELNSRYIALIEKINKLHGKVLALDIPSGLHADTGRVLGAAIHATHTITFLGLKPGLLTLDGPDYCGTIHLDTLQADTGSASADGCLIDHQLVAAFMQPRAHNSHKGSYGSVGIIGGADGMTGAALLAGRAALHMGAGRVYVGMLAANSPTVDLIQPELMLRPVSEIFAQVPDCLIVGPGLGLSAQAQQIVADTLATSIPLILDADALNLISAKPQLRAALYKREAATIITPHPTEAARLLEQTTERVQADRIAAAQALAALFSCSVLLKGAGSICAFTNSEWFINTSGNAGLASGGTGDVLSGMLGALLGQKVGAREALLLGVFLHGAAADNLVKRGIGPIGMTASEIIIEARKLINEAVEKA